MPAKRETLLCRYRYDPLDRVADCAPLNRENIQRFYRQSRLATEIQGQVQHSVFQHDEQLLAHQRHEAGGVDSTLLATDQQRSVLYGVGAGQRQQVAYSPYGHRSPEGGLISLLGFNGERPDPVTGHYLLGNGYRAFNPVLMRFNSPDSLSPFGKGGLNAYAYCLGDPVNLVDPMGDFALIARGITHLVSAPIAAARPIGRGLDAVARRVSRGVNALGRTVGKKVRMRQLKADPKVRSRVSNEARAIIDQDKLSEAGIAFRKAREEATPSPLFRLAKHLGKSEGEVLAQPQFMNSLDEQKKLHNLPRARADFRAADDALSLLTYQQITKHPTQVEHILSLVRTIRAQ